MQTAMEWIAQAIVKIWMIIIFAIAAIAAFIIIPFAFIYGTYLALKSTSNRDK